MVCWWSTAALKRENPDQVRSIVQRHSGSVWIGKGESQAQWGLIQAALELFEACDDFESNPETTLSLIHDALKRIRVALVSARSRHPSTSWRPRPTMADRR